MPVVLPPVPQPVDLSGARVLVADDVADTGATLKLVKEFCAEHVAEVRCAVIYEKPATHGALRVRLAPDEPLDQLPVVGRSARGRAGPCNRDA